jgi:hypothetical protein
MSLVLWALNDHVLKGWAPGVLTGKLSDVTALVVCPTVLVGLIEWCLPRLVRERPRAVLGASCGAIGFLAIGLELIPPVMLGFQHALGLTQYVAHHLAAQVGLGRRVAYALVQNTPDVTDLACLPALFVSWWLVAKARHTSCSIPSVSPGKAWERSSVCRRSNSFGASV